MEDVRHILEIEGAKNGGIAFYHSRSTAGRATRDATTETRISSVFHELIRKHASAQLATFVHGVLGPGRNDKSTNTERFVISHIWINESQFNCAWFQPLTIIVSIVRQYLWRSIFMICRHVAPNEAVVNGGLQL